MNLKALGGLSQCMHFSREPTVVGIFFQRLFAPAVFLFVSSYMFVCLLIYLLLFSSLFRFLFIFVADVFSSGIWSSLSSCRDPSLQELAYKLPSTVLVSKAPGTIDSYRRAFARWKEFAAAKEEIEAFPAKTEHVALYLEHLLDSTQSYSVVDSAIYAIQWAHNLAALPSPVDAPIIRDISKAAKKMNGAHVVNRKQAVTADMIGTLVSASNLSNLLELRNVCIFVLAFAGFFRINEVLHIKYGDVRFQSGYVAIDVTSSKTDQLRKGSEVVIASGRVLIPALLTF